MSFGNSTEYILCGSQILAIQSFECAVAREAARLQVGLSQHAAVLELCIEISIVTATIGRRCESAGQFPLLVVSERSVSIRPAGMALLCCALGHSLLNLEQ